MLEKKEKNQSESLLERKEFKMTVKLDSLISEIHKLSKKVSKDLLKWVDKDYKVISPMYILFSLTYLFNLSSIYCFNHNFLGFYLVGNVHTL